MFDIEKNVRNTSQPWRRHFHICDEVHDCVVIQRILIIMLSLLYGVNYYFDTYIENEKLPNQLQVKASDLARNIVVELQG